MQVNHNCGVALEMDFQMEGDYEMFDCGIELGYNDLMEVELLKNTH
jgi:hypothetical protein